MFFNLLLGVFVAIYVFATRWVKNEPLKSKIDSSVNNVNGYLLLLVNNNSSYSYDILARMSYLSSNIITTILVISALLIFILPLKILSFILPFLSGIFVVSWLLNLSIEWKHNHKKTVIDFFFKNIGMLSVLLAPIVIFCFSYFTQDVLFEDFIETVFPFYFNNIWLTQLLWFLIIFISMYLCFWIISYPIYMLLRVLIATFSFIIKIFNKYINTNILDGLVGFAVLCIAISKML